MSENEFDTILGFTDNLHIQLFDEQNLGFNFPQKYYRIFPACVFFAVIVYEHSKR